MKSKFLILLIFTAFLMACNTSKEPVSGNPDGKDSLQTVVVYVCPMKCEGKTYTQPGKCPVCGMELVVKE